MLSTWHKYGDVILCDEINCTGGTMNSVSWDKAQLGVLYKVMCLRFLKKTRNAFMKWVTLRFSRNIALRIGD